MFFFLYWLTQVFVGQRPLNGLSCRSVILGILVIIVMCCVSNSHAGFGPLCVALADHALTLMETIMADLKLESLSLAAVSSHLSKACNCRFLIQYNTRQ